jgi:hypothetical protein
MAEQRCRAQDGCCNPYQCELEERCLRAEGMREAPQCPKGKGDCFKVLPDKRCFGCPANAGVAVTRGESFSPADADGPQERGL